MEVVQTRALSKVYGKKSAVDELSMTVHEGDLRIYRKKWSRKINGAEDAVFAGGSHVGRDCHIWKAGYGQRVQKKDRDPD